MPYTCANHGSFTSQIYLLEFSLRFQNRVGCIQLNFRYRFAFVLCTELVFHTAVVILADSFLGPTHEQIMQTLPGKFTESWYTVPAHSSGPYSKPILNLVRVLEY
jgi:hypothetical protein